MAIADIYDKEGPLVDSLELLSTAPVADQVASEDEEAEERNRLQSEIEDLRSEVESLKSDPRREGERMELFSNFLALVLSNGVRSSSWADCGKSSRGARAGYVQKDSIFRDGYDIYDPSGRMRGYRDRDPLFRDRVDIYDRRGRQEGYVEKDPLCRNRWDLHH
jgi:hypothetical protein